MLDLNKLSLALENEEFVTQLAAANSFNIDLIFPNPHQPRFDENVEELKASIEAAYNDLLSSNDFDESKIKPEDGLLEPIIISPRDDGTFVCVGGHRRLKACKELNHTSIKANCISLNEQQLLSFSIVENLQRVNLTSLETALAIDKAISSNIFKSEKHLCEVLGKSQSFVSKCKSVLKLPKQILDDLYEDKSKIGLEILVDLQRVKDNDIKIELYEKYKKGEIKQAEIREAIKREKNFSKEKHNSDTSQKQSPKEEINHTLERFDEAIKDLDCQAKIFTENFPNKTKILEARIEELEKEIEELNNKEVYIVSHRQKKGSASGGGFRCRAYYAGSAIEIAKEKKYKDLANDKNIIWEARTLKSGDNVNTLDDYIGYGFGTVNDFGTYIAVIDGDFEATITFEKNGEFIKNTNNREYQVIIKYLETK